MLTELMKAVETKRKSLEGDGEKVGMLAAINGKSLMEYRALWNSFTPPGPFPCPFCFLFEGKVSHLKTMPRQEDVEPLHCTECGETFDIPVELLYA